MSWEILERLKDINAHLWRSKIGKSIYFVTLFATLLGLVSLAMFMVIGFAEGKPITEIIHDWVKAWADLWDYLQGWTLLVIAYCLCSLCLLSLMYGSADGDSLRLSIVMGCGV